jgi:hypothetical protein
MTTIASVCVGRPTYGPHWESWKHIVHRCSRDPNLLQCLNGRPLGKEEAERGVPYPAEGLIYLRPKWLEANTVAHELGHHAVHCLDPHGTPGHGKIWVGRFDDAAEAVAVALDDYGRSRGAKVPILVSDERLAAIRVSA